MDVIIADGFLDVAGIEKENSDGFFDVGCMERIVAAAMISMLAGFDVASMEDSLPRTT